MKREEEGPDGWNFDTIFIVEKEVRAVDTFRVVMNEADTRQALCLSHICLKTGHKYIQVGVLLPLST
jgi:hypothetical protein